MAAIYDEQGNYVGDDGAPSLDQMKLELVKKNQPLSAQIPGYDRPIPQAQAKPDPLGSAAGNFTELATKFNPLMMAKSMREAAGIVTVPAVAAVKGVGESILTSPAGTYTSGKAPAYAEQVAKQFMEQNAPQTPMAQEFAGAIAPYMAELPAYLGHLQTGRPAFTPNDLRVMGAEATRVGRQVKDIPTDFVNAQSGLQKLDPITGQPTYGAKLQGVAESVGDIMAQREMQGLPPIPGLPASMQPTSPKLYAMRPEGSRVTSAVVPETAKADVATYAPARDLVASVISDTQMTPLQALDEIQNNILRAPEAVPARKAFENFLKQKAKEMYPDAPSNEEALAAYKARFGNREASAAHTLGMYDEFLQTPEGIQFRAALDLPSAEELPAMHEAAANWLNSQFTNYINEKVGTPSEPGIKLASQGLTFMPPEGVFEAAYLTGNALADKRTKAGMPAKTATDEALTAADQKLVELQQQTVEALNRKREQTQAAIDAGYGAPGGPNLGQFEPFAQASRDATKLSSAYKKQQQLVDNLRLGAAYESAIDTAITAQPAKDLKEDIDYRERQFYPALMRTPDAEQAYTVSTRQLQNLGFDELARNFYNDVMSRKIHLDKIPKMTVEKYIRDTAEGRITKEKAEQAKVANYKNAVDRQFKASADAYIPNDKVFGNVGVLEITDKFTPEEVAKLVSEDTTALDVCIGEGGTTSGRPNLWHPGTGNRQYVPIYDVATGERNPEALSPRMTYIDNVARGSQMVSFRDIITGEPVAIFDFNPVTTPSGRGKFDINFTSGRRNRQVKPEYVDGIKDYLNSREDTIRSASIENLRDNLDLVDSKRAPTSELARAANMPTSEFKQYDLSGMPRFVTSKDIRNYIESIKANTPPAPISTPASQRPSESLAAYTTGAVASAIDNVLDSQRRAFDELGESNNFIQSEAFFESMRTRFEQDLDRGLDPVLAVDSLKQRLYDLENEYGNSNLVSRNTIADGMQDLMESLNLMRDYMLERQAAETAQPRPRAIVAQGDPMPNLDTPELLSVYRDRLTDEQVDWLQDFAARWEDATTPEITGNMIDEYANWRENNRLLPEGRPDYLRMTHDAAQTLTRQMGEEAGNEMRAAIRGITEIARVDPVNDTSQFIHQLRLAADDAGLGTVEIALHDLANDIETAYMRDWEPEVAEPPPAAREPMITTDIADIIDTISNAVGENTTPGVGNRVGTIAYRLAQHVDARANPVAYANALRNIDTVNEHVAVASALRGIADQIEERTRDAEPARMAYREPSQVEANVMQDGVLATLDLQFADLVDNVNNAAALRFASMFRRLLSERGLDFEPTVDTLPDFGNAMDGLRADIREQLAPLGREGFEGVAIANALRNMYYVLEQYVRDLEVEPARLPREADLANQRNDRMIQLENAVNDPELNPEDLRFLANELSNPLNQAANDHWISLTERERREYALALRERANYIEFSPADFAIRLSNEAGADIADLRDTVQALNDGTFDHEILRGLPSIERDRAAQRTALNLNHILQGMQDDAGRRGNADGGPVRGYQAGGSVKKPEVKTPWLGSISNYSDTVAYEMYPGQRGQDDQRDAARHMLAAGTLSRKYGPGTAEFLGKAHEYVTSPLQAVKTLFGGKMPADFDMDTHNNAVGARLGQRAKTQAELEDLVQEEAERASRTQTPDKAFIRKANGGIVQQNPTTDQMRYALMMRRK